MLRTFGVCLRSGIKGSRLKSSPFAAASQSFVERRMSPSRNFTVLKENIDMDSPLLTASSTDPTNVDILSASPGNPVVEELNILAYSFFSSSEEPA